MNINEVYRRRCRQQAKTGLRLGLNVKPRGRDLPQTDG